MTSIDAVTRRVTGPSCNFITALTKRVWAFNEGNVGQWEKIEEGEVIALHQTLNDYKLGKRKSSIIGFAVVGREKGRKSEFWWADEVENEKLKWPYWISLKAMYMFGDASHVDTSIPVHKKSDAQLRAESDALSRNCILLSTLNKEAKSRGLGEFPSNGSTSRMDEQLVSVIMDLASSFPEPAFEDEEDSFSAIAESSITGLDQLSNEDLLKRLREYQRKKGKGHHQASKRSIKQRIEDQLQKKIIAKLEDYTCQVCGFREAYKSSKGRTRYIIDIDHIREKSGGGGEEGNNLWALCPNCHRKKTAGIIRIDPNSLKVTERGEELSIRDHHLFACLPTKD